MNDEKQKKVLEVSDAVSKLTNEVNAILVRGVTDLFPEPVAGGGERWLTYGRIINVIFRHHYGIAMNMAEDKVEEIQKEVDKN